MTTPYDMIPLPGLYIFHFKGPPARLITFLFTTNICFVCHKYVTGFTRSLGFLTYSTLTRQLLDSDLNNSYKGGMRTTVTSQ